MCFNLADALLGTGSEFTLKGVLRVVRRMSERIEQYNLLKANEKKSSFVSEL